MELDEVVYRYRGSKMQVRYGLIALISLIPAFMNWLNQGDAVAARRTIVEAQVTLDRQKFEAAKQKTAEMPALMAKLSEIEAELVKAKQILPDKIEMDGILSSLAKLEKELDVKITKFTPGVELQPDPTLDYRELSIDLGLRAPFQKTMRFLDRLVHMPNLTHIRNIQFTRLSESGDGKNGIVSPVLETNAKLILFKGI